MTVIPRIRILIAYLSSVVFVMQKSDAELSWNMFQRIKQKRMRDRLEPKSLAEDLLMGYSYTSWVPSLLLIPCHLHLCSEPWFLPLARGSGKIWGIYSIAGRSFRQLVECTTHPKAVPSSMTVAKTVVSCATALILVRIIPDLANWKPREVIVESRGIRLDTEMVLTRQRMDKCTGNGRRLQMLAHQIQSTLDMHTVSDKALAVLRRTSALKECKLGMPTWYKLEPNWVSKVQHTHSTMKRVYTKNPAVVMNPKNPVAIPRSRKGDFIKGDFFSVRILLLHFANFHIVEGPESTEPFALMVMPPESARRWHIHEPELVEIVTNKVSSCLYLRFVVVKVMYLS